ncbi:MAG: MFS transporter [Burkholderiales bacterium]|nr:MFS transporter [Burkholderiales bacterium]
MRLLPGYDLSREQKKIVVLSSLGGLLEFYDFTIYGLFAVYFAQQFFPSSNEFIAIIASYSIFVVGYIVRPLGGILFSHIGDEIGRKTVLIITMILMGVSSLGMGLLPTYAQIGLFAPALMLLFRLIQGLAIGGELPSMIVYVSESMPHKRGFGLGGAFSGTVAGLIPGMLINLLIVHWLSVEQINSFGWRIPFILGGFLCFIGYLIRRELHETAEFKKIKQHEAAPFIEVLRHHFGKVIIGVGLVSIMATPIILLIIFMPTYLTKLAHIPAQIASDAVLVASVVSVLSIYVMGILANKYSVYKLMRNSLILILPAAALCYYLIGQQSNLILGLGVFAVFQGFLVVLPTIVISYLFPVNIRLTGVALAYNISFVLFGGLTPIVITSIIAETTGLVLFVPFGVLLLTVAFAYWALRRSRQYLVE